MHGLTLSRSANAAGLRTYPSHQPRMELDFILYGEGLVVPDVYNDQRFARQADRTLHLFDGKVVSEPAPAG